MAISVQMPALGESVTEGTVTRWLKQEGDTVEVDEPLLEVSTDKVDTEIPSPAAGVLTKIVAQEDDTVEVGGELAVIGDADDSRRRRAATARDAAEPPTSPSRARTEPEPEPEARTGARARAGARARVQARREDVRLVGLVDPGAACPNWASRSPRAPSPAG